MPDSPEEHKGSCKIYFMHEVSPHCSDWESAFCEASMQEYFSLFYSPTSFIWAVDETAGVVRGVRERWGVPQRRPVCSLRFIASVSEATGWLRDKRVRGWVRLSEKCGRNELGKRARFQSAPLWSLVTGTQTGRWALRSRRYWGRGGFWGRGSVTSHYSEATQRSISDLWAAWPRAEQVMGQKRRRRLSGNEVI